MLNTLLDIAKKEREHFLKEYGREPTEKEAERIAETILRQLRTAQVMLR